MVQRTKKLLVDPQKLKKLNKFKFYNHNLY